MVSQTPSLSPVSPFRALLTQPNPPGCRRNLGVGPRAAPPSPHDPKRQRPNGSFGVFQPRPGVLLDVPKPSRWWMFLQATRGPSVGNGDTVLRGARPSAKCLWGPMVLTQPAPNLPLQGGREHPQEEGRGGLVVGSAEPTATGPRGHHEQGEQTQNTRPQNTGTAP